MVESLMWIIASLPRGLRYEVILLCGNSFEGIAALEIFLVLVPSGCSTVPRSLYVRERKVRVSGLKLPWTNYAAVVLFVLQST